MTSDNSNHPEKNPRNPADQASLSADRTAEGNDRQSVDGGLDEQIDATR